MLELLKYENIHVPKNNQYKTGVILKSEDIFILHEIYIHSTIRATSLHGLYGFFSNGKRSKTSISNRLRKLVDAGVLFQVKETVGHGEALSGLSYYHYRLGPRGIEMLVSIGIVERGKGEKVLHSSARRGVPSGHFRAASNLANRILIHLLSNSPTLGYQHIRGSLHDELGNTNETDLKQRGLIIPDWIFERENTIIAIEVDTGSQRKEVINRKYTRYKKMAKNLLAKGKHLVVVFAVTDSSVMDISVGMDLRRDSRSRRVASLKDTFPLFTEWPENLEIFVATARRIPLIVERLLNGQGKSKSEQLLYLETWEEFIESYIPGNHALHLEPIKVAEEKGLTLKRNRNLDATFFMQHTKSNQIFSQYLMLYAEEGSVLSYQMIRNNVQLSKLANHNPKNRTAFRVFVLYYHKGEADEDVYGFEMDGCDIYVSNIETMEWKRDGTEATAYHLKVSTPFKKEEVNLFI